MPWRSSQSSRVNYLKYKYQYQYHSPALILSLSLSRWDLSHWYSLFFSDNLSLSLSLSLLTLGPGDPDGPSGPRTPRSPCIKKHNKASNTKWKQQKQEVSVAYRLLGFCVDWCFIFSFYLFLFLWFLSCAPWPSKVLSNPIITSNEIIQGDFDCACWRSSPALGVLTGPPRAPTGPTSPCSPRSPFTQRQHEIHIITLPYVTNNHPLSPITQSFESYLTCGPLTDFPGDPMSPTDPGSPVTPCNKQEHSTRSIYGQPDRINSDVHC